MSKIVKVVLDTNFLMIPGQYGLDVFEEIQKALDNKIEVHVSSGSLKELEKLKKTANGADKAAAKLALQLIEKKKLKIIDTGDEYVDDELVRLSQEDDYLIATQDAGLKKRLKKYIYLRQKKYIRTRGLME